MLKGRYQASLEFLTTYGWAIAVVILVLAILFSTGILSFSSSVPNSISGFSSTPVSSAAADLTALEMSIGNNVGQPINITGIIINSSGRSYSNFSCQNNYIYPGQSTICRISGSFSDPAYIAAEILYKIPPNNKVQLSSIGSLIIHLSNSKMVTTTKFTETGLPPGTSWNVVYDGMTYSSTTTSITFFTGSGNYSYTIPNIVASSGYGCKTRYNPNPSSNMLTAGSNLPVTFANLSGCKMYVINYFSNTTQMIYTLNNTIGATMSSGRYPQGLAIAPNGNRVYIANGYIGTGGNTTTIIYTANNTVGTNISLYQSPGSLVITPNGNEVYIANSKGGLKMLYTANNTVGANISSGSNVASLAITPNGKKLYMARWTPDTVAMLYTANNTVGANLTFGVHASGVATAPNGNIVYETSDGSHRVSAIYTANTSIKANISVFPGPYSIAITPNGLRAYASNWAGNTVSMIYTANNTVGTNITVGSDPRGVTITPNGKRVYVAIYSKNLISMIYTANNTVGTNITVGSGPQWVAVGNINGGG